MEVDSTTANTMAITTRITARSGKPARTVTCGLVSAVQKLWEFWLPGTYAMWGICFFQTRPSVSGRALSVSTTILTFLDDSSDMNSFFFFNLIQHTSCERLSNSVADEWSLVKVFDSRIGRLVMFCVTYGISTS